MRLLVIASLLSLFTTENTDAHYHRHYTHRHRSTAHSSRMPDVYTPEGRDDLPRWGSPRLGVPYPFASGTTMIVAYKGLNPVTIVGVGCAGDWSSTHLEDALRRYGDLLRQQRQLR